MASNYAIEDLQEEIKELKRQLSPARCNNDTAQTPPPAPGPTAASSDPFPSLQSTHQLLLLADSALPLGSFAYSSGLESFLAHTKAAAQQQQQQQNQRSSTTTSSSITNFHKFLALSLSSLASTALPYLLAAHRCPQHLEILDNDLDASTPCTVARRASVAQGLALLGVWERAFRQSYTATTSGSSTTDGYVSRESTAAALALSSFSSSLKLPDRDVDFGLGANGHLAPLWGVVCAAMAVSLQDSAYMFMLNHVKAVLSAAVRASVLGPYQAQGILASNGVREMILERMRREWERSTDEAGQSVPVLDLWLGRHELLYSRIFNS
jgi:urease accessory protein